jgi:hypothetical protein
MRELAEAARALDAREREDFFSADMRCEVCGDKIGVAWDGTDDPLCAFADAPEVPPIERKSLARCLEMVSAMSSAADADLQIGNIAGAAQRLRDAKNLLPVIDREARDTQISEDIIEVSRAELEACEAMNTEYERAVLEGPLLCESCSADRSRRWAEGDDAPVKTA